MRLSTGMLASTAIAAISLGQAQAAISGLHSTGSDVVGGIDQAWTVDGGSAFAINNPAGVGWVGNTALSKWISNVPDTLGGPGPFTYSTTFSATAGPNAISGLMSADDQGAVYLNGNLVFTGSPDSSAPWSFLEPFSITSGFDVGLNVLTVLVPNNIETSNDGPTGLQIAFVPEPATWAMLVVGFLGLGVAGFRTAKAKAVAA